MTQYEAAPGYLHHMGLRFTCPCGNKDMRVEVGPVPTRFWCTCGTMYTEDLVGTLSNDLIEVADSGE